MSRWGGEPRRWRPGTWSVRARLSAVATIAATTGLAVAGLIAYLVTNQLLYDEIDDSLRGAPGLSPGSAPRTPEVDRLCEVISKTDAPAPGLFTVEVVRADGTVCATPSEPAVATHGSLAESIALDRNPGMKIHDGAYDDGTPARIATVPLEGGGAVLLARDTSSAERLLTTLRLSLIGVTFGGGLIALILSRSASRAGLRPITRFAHVAEEIAATGSLEPDAFARVTRPDQADHSGDELARLSRSFNAMALALTDAQEQQRRLVADAGHELRTPLASLRANISLLHRSRRLHRPLPDGQEEQLLTDLHAQMVELSTLVDDLSELAWSGTQDPRFESLRLDHVIERAVERVRSRAGQRSFDVALAPSTVVGDDFMLERAVVNLLDNAIKFSPADSGIDVRLLDGVLSVTDRGVGIAVADQERAFGRFWRSPSARSLPGSGLGLSIVADTARRHGGWATLEPHAGGTTARLCIPATGTGADSQTSARR